MIPVYIPSPGGNCFATYGAGAGPAVLFCPPFGDEALKTARVWRDLACELGEAGLATLRFDLPGTGNSEGSPDQPDRVAAWRGGLLACAEWLKVRHGGRLVLFGHRFGALLALDAIGGGLAVERAVLLDPPASGAAHVRHLRARAALDRAGSPIDGSELIQPGGMPLSAATMHELAALPAPFGGGPAPPALVVVHETAGAPNPWPERLRTAGSAVRTLAFEGFDEFVPRDAFQAKRPGAVLQQVATYLTEKTGPRRAQLTGAPAPGHLHGDGFGERPIFFGSDRRLFGILCEPERPPRGGRALLLPTTGVDPCCGMAQMWTELARRLARDGVTSLRFDTSGVGESGGTLGQSLLAGTYHPDRVADLKQAVDELVAQGFDRVAVVGYCSGAYAAWHAALSDGRIGALMAGNLVYLHLQTGTSEEALRARPGASRIGLRPGKLPEGVRHRATTALRRVDDRLRRMVPRPVRTALRGLGADPAAARRHLRALVKRGCTVELVMAEDDHGHLRLRRAFGETPRLPKGAALTVIADADHRFSDRRHRARFLDLAASFALQRPPTARMESPA